MTPYKQIIISDHAQREMRKALPPITRADIRNVFERGARSLAKEQRPGGEVRWAKRYIVPRREKLAEIIYFEHATEAEIITVYWVGNYD